MIGEFSVKFNSLCSYSFCRKFLAGEKPEIAPLSAKTHVRDIFPGLAVKADAFNSARVVRLYTGIAAIFCMTSSSQISSAKIQCIPVGMVNHIIIAMLKAKAKSDAI